jgi:ubiquinone/menaquinone biosynthesis C-methylase UbiE
MFDDRVMMRRVNRKVMAYLGRLRSRRGYRAQVDVQYAPAEAEVSRGAPCIVSLTNIGDQTWHTGGWHPVNLSYHWRAGARTIEGIRFSLPDDVHPGEQAVIECLVPVPPDEGEYVLEFDLVREHIAWFQRDDSPTAQVRCAIKDFDYETAYRRTDLEKNYWSIVGPATREQHEYLGREKRKMLIAQGMTTHSRVLDVGCGTGQLTEALVDYLSDEGVYYGTDIAQEAVTFCQKKFRRPNFFFLKNDMTSVPISGPQFDVILVSSVFTHMYPPEIEAMLRDLKRVMAPSGLIVADVFVSPHVQTFAGNRSRIELNDRHLGELIRETGLAYERQGSIVQPGGGRRLGIVFRNGR